MRANLTDLPVEVEQGELITRYVEWGGMAIRYVRLPADTDMGPVLEGLPHDRCPSDHWGTVLEGSIHMLHHDGTKEVVSAGEAFFWPAGHTAWTEEPVTFLEVGPRDAMRQFGDHAKAKVG